MRSKAKKAKKIQPRERRMLPIIDALPTDRFCTESFEQPPLIVRTFSSRDCGCDTFLGGVERILKFHKRQSILGVGDEDKEELIKSQATNA